MCEDFPQQLQSLPSKRHHMNLELKYCFSQDILTKFDGIGTIPGPQSTMGLLSPHIRQIVTYNQLLQLELLSILIHFLA